MFPTGITPEINYIEVGNPMRTTCLSIITAAVALTLVTACGATDEPGAQVATGNTAPEVAQVAAQSAAPDIAQITATIEKAGFTCEVKERHPKTVVQVAQCRSNQNKYRLLIASEWKDPKARDQMYEHDLPGRCDALGLKGQVRWSSSGNWLLVAGGSKETDVNALDQATAALGFEPHQVACQ